MTVDEAIDSMEAVGHDFFVFREMETDAIQVGGEGFFISAADSLHVANC